MLTYPKDKIKLLHYDKITCVAKLDWGKHIAFCDMKSRTTEFYTKPFIDEHIGHYNIKTILDEHKFKAVESIVFENEEKNVENKNNTDLEIKIRKIIEACRKKRRLPFGLIDNNKCPIWNDDDNDKFTHTSCNSCTCDIVLNWILKKETKENECEPKKVDNEVIYYFKEVQDENEIYFKLIPNKNKYIKVVREERASHISIIYDSCNNLICDYNAKKRFMKIQKDSFIEAYNMVIKEMNIE